MRHLIMINPFSAVPMFLGDMEHDIGIIGVIGTNALCAGLNSLLSGSIAVQLCNSLSVLLATLYIVQPGLFDAGLLSWKREDCL